MVSPRRRLATRSKGEKNTTGNTWGNKCDLRLVRPFVLPCQCLLGVSYIFPSGILRGSPRPAGALVETTPPYLYPQQVLYCTIASELWNFNYERNVYRFCVMYRDTIPLSSVGCGLLVSALHGLANRWTPISIFTR